MLSKKCAVCGKEFFPRKNRYDKTKTCSRACQHINQITKKEKICEVCGNKFLICKGRYEKARFCSKKCQNIKIRKKEVTCEECGKIFKYKTGAKYCSAICTGKSQREGVDNHCKTCGKIIYTKKSKGTKFCSQKCMGVYYSKYHTGEKSSHYKGVGVIKNCLICGKEFFAEEAKNRFCSNKCASIDSGKKHSGKNHHNYKDGRTPVTSAIRTSSKSFSLTKQVIKRDKYSCRLCGAKRKLHAHHIFPFAKIYSKFVKLYPKKTSKEDLVRLALEHEPFFNINNLVTLCTDCHYKEHRQKKQQEINFD
jgi:endogenous inhibitor of DNA gyrase (YacG/DUF329 family)